MITGQLLQALQELKTMAADREDLLAAWRSANDEAWLAYEAWRDAAHPRKPDAWSVYIAAVDREGAAAAALASAPGFDAREAA
jgi:hypothetical protein